MPDLDIIGENSGSLSLTAADIRSMTEWPDQLIIDYLNLVEMMNRITTAINSDFGTMALQNADAVAITGGTISGVTLDDIFIGDVTATNVTTVNLTATGTVNLHDVTITGYTHATGFTDDATSVQVTITDSLVNIGQDTDLGSTVSVTYVTLDGTNDYMLRGAALTGATATKNITIVARIRIDAAASNNRYIFEGIAGAVLCKFQIVNATNILMVSIDNVAGTNPAVYIESTTGYTSADGWLNICISADVLNDTEGQCRVNGVDDYNAATSDLDNEALGYAACTNWAVGSQVATTAKYNGDIAFLYVNIDAAIDFDVEANERLFFDASGIPVYLGANGELPTGTAPIMYFNGAASSFPTNKGTGGGMTLTGSIAGATEEFGVLHITDGGYYTDSALLGDMGAETFNSLGYYQDGVYVPTISSLSIFTNKTIDIDLNTITVAGGANGQTLIYNATTGKFDNATLTEGVGIDVLNAAGAITLSLDIVGLTTDTIAAGDFIAFADITETNIPNKTTWANAALTITAVGTLTVLQVDNININGNTISSTAGTDLLITPLAGQQLILDGTIEIDAGVVTGATSITSTQFLGALNGSVGAITPAAGTFTVVVVDNITIDLNTISTTSGALNLTPIAGSAIVLDGTISVDAGVVTGATSITSVDLSLSNDLTFTGTGNRILGDFSNGTLSNRVSFQTTTVDSFTVVATLPNGTSAISSFQSRNNSDPTNSANIQIQCNATASQLLSNVNGSGTLLPLQLGTNNVVAVTIDTSNRVLVSLSPTSQPITGSAATSFQVTGVDGASGITASRWQNSATDGAFIGLKKSRSAVIGTPGIVLADDKIGSVEFYADDGVQGIPAAAIVAYVDGTPGLNDMPGRLSFCVTADGAASLTEKLRLSNTGALKLVGDFKCGDGTAVGDTPEAPLHIRDTGSNLLFLDSTLAGAGTGPTIRLFRRITGATNNVLGGIQWEGLDAGGAFEIYGVLDYLIVDATAGSEDSAFRIGTVVAGTIGTRLQVRRGMYMTGATGADMGAGTFNAVSQYETGRKIGGVVASKFTNTGNVGAGTDTLQSVTIPAALLFNDGDAFCYEAAGTFAISGTTKTIVVSFGGTTILTTGALAISGGNWCLEVTVIKDGTDSWRAHAEFFTNNAALVATVANVGSTALDLDAAQTFLVTGATSGVVDNDVVMTDSKLNFNPG